MSAFPEFTRGGELLFAFDEAGAKAVLTMGSERGCYAATVALWVCGTAYFRESINVEQERSIVEVNGHEIETLLVSDGSAFAKMCLVQMYVQGVGVEVNSEYGWGFVKEAALQGCMYAIVWKLLCDASLSNIIEAQDIVEASGKKAIKEFNYNIGCAFSGIGELCNARRAWIAGAHAGDHNAMYMAARALESGYFGLSSFKNEEKDDIMAGSLHQGSAWLGSYGSMIHVGRCYERAQCGHSKNIKLAREWYQRAFDSAGDSNATLPNYWLGNSYFSQNKHLSVDEKDDKKAFDYFSVGATDNNLKCFRSLAKCFSNGLGVDRDKKKAFSLRKKTAQHKEADNSDFYEIGCLLETGDGVEKDIPLALQWFSRAACNDHVGSISRIADIYLGDGDVDKGVRLFVDNAWRRQRNGETVDMVALYLKLSECYTDEQELKNALMVRGFGPPCSSIESRVEAVKRVSNAIEDVACSYETLLGSTPWRRVPFVLQSGILRHAFRHVMDHEIEQGVMIALSRRGVVARRGSVVVNTLKWVLSELPGEVS